ncbi:MAG TPA: hypothetical protein VGM82_23410 [Gemmatimonadaceae bacterium]|jgi:hypothetical protein
MIDELEFISNAGTVIRPLIKQESDRCRCRLAGPLADNRFSGGIIE